MIDVITPGFSPHLVPYDDALRLQRDIHHSVAAGERADTLLLLEHEAVFTAGTRTTPTERPSIGTPVIDVDRGGKLTWHGPGQLVGYPIVRLPQPVDGVAYVRRLEAVLIQVLAGLGVAGRSIRGRTGVWVDGSEEPSNAPAAPNKIAAIGVRVADGVTMHGFALNCSNSLEPFSRIVPCGIRDAGVTSISTTTGTTVTPSQLAPIVAAEFTRAFAPAFLTAGANA